MHKQPRMTFKRRRVISPYPGYMLDSDMAVCIDLAKYYDNYKYILFCIDVFSRYALATPLKSKRTGEVIHGYKTLIAKGMKATILGRIKPATSRLNKRKRFLRQAI